MAERKSIEVSEEQKRAAIEVLWSWDQDYETGEELLARLLIVLSPPLAEKDVFVQAGRTCQQQAL